MWWSGGLVYRIFFFVRQETAYEMRIMDWSSDVCSSDLLDAAVPEHSEKAFRLPNSGQRIYGSQSVLVDPFFPIFDAARAQVRIGRASCRERVCQYVEISVVDVPLKKKIT